MSRKRTFAGTRERDGDSWEPREGERSEAEEELQVEVGVSMMTR